MSRFYSMGLIVKKENLSQEDFEKIEKVYAEEWASDTGYRDIKRRNSSIRCRNNSVWWRKRRRSA